MDDEDRESKKKKFLEAYVSHRDKAQKKAFSSSSSTQVVDISSLHDLKVRTSSVVPRTDDPVLETKERIPIRELVRRRARAPEDKLSTSRHRKRPGYRLVKDRADTRVRGVTPRSMGKKKRVSLYDLYPTGAYRPDTEEAEEEYDEEDLRFPDDGPPSKEVEVSEEDPGFTKDDAADLLFAPRRKRTKHLEAPILKVGPDPEELHEEADEVMDAGTFMESAHGTQALEESQLKVGPDVPGSEGIGAEEGAVEDVTAHGEVCAACGSVFDNYNSPMTCTSCGVDRCNTCNMYDMGHTNTNVYYDYDFDHPLCISCYEKAFTIQKLLGKARMCYGNGNMTYALYYAQNALRVDPGSKYDERANSLIDKIQEARGKRVHQIKSWRSESKNITRARFQDPGWTK